jgi:hypothetical protein
MRARRIFLYFVLAFCFSGSHTAGWAQTKPAAKPGAKTVATTAVAEAPDPSLPPGSWRFIVSGDSRNCGDVVMPAIAAKGKFYHPKFYWHLGDLRAIYEMDEDMAAAATLGNEPLTCTTYKRRAWDDFIENQYKAFDGIPFYLGIGNHEVIPPKNEDEFKRRFRVYLDIPSLRQQRLVDHEPAQPETYYHWIERGVDFIYLDNANNFFSEEQLTWFFRRLSDAQNDSHIKSLVVGMHEALPDSIANSHSLGDGTDPRGRTTGTMVYNALRDFDKDADSAVRRPVYVLASHSHFYLANIFDTDALKAGGRKPLYGWIVGTGGAQRYLMPDGSPWLQYGYAVATVSAEGKIDFEFREVLPDDVPASVKKRYPEDLIPWCWKNNSKARDPHPQYSNQFCPLPNPDAEKAKAPAGKR